LQGRLSALNAARQAQQRAQRQQADLSQASQEPHPVADEWGQEWGLDSDNEVLGELDSEMLKQADPEFSEENESRLELARAYLEIEDYEAVQSILGELQGDLSEGQAKELRSIKRKLSKGGAKA
ncbi:MAG: hypothetical protein R3194_08285, partial [Limnobacter sp.]|nr:hypothetical protein [Limnobacter sp.]